MADISKYSIFVLNGVSNTSSAEEQLVRNNHSYGHCNLVRGLPDYIYKIIPVYYVVKYSSFFDFCPFYAGAVQYIDAGGNSTNNPKKGFISGVVGSKNNYYLKVVDPGKFKDGYLDGVDNTIRSGSRSFGNHFPGWNDAVGGRDKAGNWGLQYYDPAKFYAPIRQNGKKK